MKKKLTVGQIRRVLDDLSGDTDSLPIIVGGGRLKVVDIQIVYQATFDTMDYCGPQDQTPIAVMLKVVAA